MALEHALLVALRERPAAGLELARRFDRSIGHFWSATHQQIYRVLRRMEESGWVASEEVGQSGRRGKTVYTVTPDGERALAQWIAEPTPPESLRSELAVKMRGATYGDRDALRRDLERRLADHQVRFEYYQSMSVSDFPDPDALQGDALDQQRDQYLVLRGGVLMEQFWIAWLTEYLEAYR